MIKRRAALLLSLLTALAVLAGCGERRVLERLGFIQVVAYDPGLDNDRLKVSFYLPKFGSEFGSTKGEFLTADARSSKEAKAKISRQTNWEMVSGQLRNVLVAESLARRGIGPHIDTLIRDPTISPRVKISIVEGEASPILKKTYEQHPSTSIYIDRLLESEILKQVIPRVSLFEFERDLLDDGIDPALPILKDLGDNLEIAGLAMFRGDKYVGKIEADDITIFSLLYRNNKKLEIYLPLDDDRQGPSHVMLNAVKSRREVKVKRQPSGQFELQIGIRARALVTEYRGAFKIDSDRQRKQLEQKISEKLSGRAEELMSLMQKKKSDSLGLGKYVRNSLSYRAWKDLNWQEEFPEAQISCEIRVELQDYGKFR